MAKMNVWGLGHCQHFIKTASYLAGIFLAVKCLLLLAPQIENTHLNILVFIKSPFLLLHVDALFPRLSGLSKSIKVADSARK